MTEFQKTLYANLMSLVARNNAFYFADFDFDGTTYRVFNYRLASYTDFLEPAALECRGVMFEVVDGNAVRVAALPMEKFFNLYENPMTMELNLTQIDLVELKADGSLISSYLHNNKVYLKSKGAIASDQALDATAFLYADTEYLDAIKAALHNNWCVNMEWCAPFNRIVLGYMEPQLTVLNVRNMETGEYVDLFTDDVATLPVFNVLRERHIERITVEDPVDFVSNIPEMVGIEGYIVRLSSGQRVKIKTEWYLTQHRAKDSIHSDRRLYEAVLAEATDDLKSLFHDDPLVIRRITNMELFVDGKYNAIVEHVERFYRENKDLERKDYAIKGQAELDRLYFGLAMSLYLGKSVDFKEFMVKHWKDFGVKDD